MNIVSTRAVFLFTALALCGLVVVEINAFSVIPLPSRGGNRGKLKSLHEHDQVLRDDVLTIPEETADDEIARSALEKAVRQSEEVFYGFWDPSGITEWDLGNSPERWTSYDFPPTRFTAFSHPQLEVDHTSSTGTAIETVDNSNLLNLILQTEQQIPHPFARNDLARVSLDPILSPEECQDIIHETQNHYWGWAESASRYGTPADRVGSMLKLESLSRTYSLVNFELLPRLFPAIVNAFPSLETSPENLRLGDCRVVKYDASKGKVELGMHRDGLLVTANIALNSNEEYTGGGTVIEELVLQGDTESSDTTRSAMPIRLDQGHVLLHPGGVRHCGAPITSGIRYVLVLFIMDKTIPDKTIGADWKLIE